MSSYKTSTMSLEGLTCRRSSSIERVRNSRKTSTISTFLSLSLLAAGNQAATIEIWPPVGIPRVRLLNFTRSWAGATACGDPACGPSKRVANANFLVLPATLCGDPARQMSKGLVTCKFVGAPRLPLARNECRSSKNWIKAQFCKRPAQPPQTR